MHHPCCCCTTRCVVVAPLKYKNNSSDSSSGKFRLRNFMSISTERSTHCCCAARFSALYPYAMRLIDAISIAGLSHPGEGLHLSRCSLLHACPTTVVAVGCLVGWSVVGDVVCGRYTRTRTHLLHEMRDQSSYICSHSGFEQDLEVQNQSPKKHSQSNIFAYFPNESYHFPLVLEKKTFWICFKKIRTVYCQFFPDVLLLYRSR